MSSADRVRYFYVKEVTQNIVPTSAAMKALRLTGEGLKPTFQYEASKELDSNRAEREMIIVGASHGGPLNHELLWDAHDDLVAAVMGQNDWTVDDGDPKIKTLQNGNAMPSFSILKQFLDMPVQANHIFTGSVVNSWDITFAKKAIMTGSFGVLSRGMNNGAIGTLLSGTPTYGTPSETDPFNGSSHISSILLDDVPFTSCVDNMTMQIINNIRPQECLGSLGPTGFTFGKFMVTISANIYFKDETLFNKYKNAEAFEWDIGLTDSLGNKLDFELPRMKFEDMEVVAGGTGQDVIAKCKARALWDPTDQRVMKLTSTAV